VLETIVVLLVILWALGFIGGFTASGLVHLLLVVALAIVVIRLLQGRKVL